MEPANTRHIIGLGGQIGSGKTTTARAIASLGNGTALTISDTVKKRAELLGLGKDRRSLQDLAWRDISSGPEAFAQDVLGDRLTGLIVIDGVRQLSVWHALRKGTAPGRAHLVFVAVPWPERVRRVYHRDGISEDELREIDAHPVESDWGELKSHADVVVDGQLDAEELAKRVLARFYSV